MRGLATKKLQAVDETDRTVKVVVEGTTQLVGAVKA
jgi:hypothetical protein